MPSIHVRGMWEELSGHVLLPCHTVPLQSTGSIKPLACPFKADCNSFPKLVAPAWDTCPYAEDGEPATDPKYTGPGLLGQCTVLFVVMPAIYARGIALSSQSLRITVCCAYRSKGADDQRVSCSKYDPTAEGITVVGSASHMTPLTKEFNAQFNNPNLTQIGSSLKFLLVRTLCQCLC